MLRWVFRGLLLVALAFANLNDIWSPDVIPNALFSWTVIREGNVDYDEFTDRLDVPPNQRIGVLMDLGIPRDTYFFRACESQRRPTQIAFRVTSPRSPGGPPPPGPDDRVCSIFPPGIAILALPVLAPFVLASGPGPLPDVTTLVRAGHLAAAVLESLATLLLWSVLRRFANARAALALVLLYFLGTSVRTVASQALWQHAGVHLALTLALWLALRERVSVRRELLAGLIMGFGITVRQTTAIVALGLARLPWPPIAMVRIGAPILYAIGVGIGAVPLLAYNAIVFGSPFEQGYGDKPFYLQGTWTGLYGLLVSPSRGILVYEPWIVAALAGLALAWTRPGLIALRLRGLSIAAVLMLLLYSQYEEWWGGRVFGPRFLDDLAPAMAVAIAWGISQGLVSSTWRRIAFWASAIWSWVLFNAAALVYDPNGWDTLPLNVNFVPARLFEWSDPQWLAVLAALPSGGARAVVALVLSAALVALLLRLEGVRVRASPA